MITLKQAVYTRVAVDGTIDYRLAGLSDGISAEDVEYLTWWGPGGDSLLDSGPDAESYNFFQLPSGALCVSRSSVGLWNGGREGSQSVYTQFLIVRSDEFHHFGDNPFSLIRQALACGVLEVLSRVPEWLPEVSIPECPVVVDQRLLGRLVQSLGARNLAMFVQEALKNKRLVVSGDAPAAAVVSGIFSCLPIGVRRDFSFSTGLKYSSRRPLRLVAIGSDECELERVEAAGRTPVLDLRDDDSIRSLHVDGWARWILAALTTDRIGFLAREITRQRETISSDELFALGLQLLEDVESLSLSGVADQLESAPVEPDFDTTESVEEDSSRSQSNKLCAQSIESTAGKSSPLHQISPEEVEMLERLDDLVYEAMDGVEASLVELKAWWPEVLDRLDEAHLSEAREHYLGHAIKVWRRCIDGQDYRDVNRAAIVLDVLCILFDEETAQKMVLG